jgi:hypothetical protein
VARKLAGWLGPLAGPGPGGCRGPARWRGRGGGWGAAPFALLFARLAGPATPGAHAFGRLLPAIDGTTVDVACAPANIAAWGPPPSGVDGAAGGFPQTRLVTLAGCGTRGLAGAAFGPRKGKGTSEQDLARQIAAGGAIRAGMLVLADRNFCGHSVISALTAAGADVPTESASQLESSHAPEPQSPEHVAEAILDLINTRCRAGRPCSPNGSAAATRDDGCQPACGSDARKADLDRPRRQLGGDYLMTAWPPEELERIGRADDLRIAVKRADGTLRRWVPIWVVDVGGQAYVRTWYRRDDGWFGHVLDSRRARIRVPGLEVDVTVEDVGAGKAGLRADVDAAYRAKYGRYRGTSVDRMVTDDAAASTLRLVPEQRARPDIG